jgi:hypothetical protein
MAQRPRSSSPSAAHDEANEVLGVLIEVRAYVEAHGAQLEGMRAHDVSRA